MTILKCIMIAFFALLIAIAGGALNVWICLKNNKKFDLKMLLVAVITAIFELLYLTVAIKVI